MMESTWCKKKGILSFGARAGTNQDLTHLVRAVKFFARDDGLGQLRIDWELGHPPAHARELARVVDGAEGVKLLNAFHERFCRGRVEKVKAEEVVDAERLEQEDNGAKIRPLDLGHRVGLELVVERPLGEKPETLAGTDATGAASSLVGGGSRALGWRTGWSGQHAAAQRGTPCNTHRYDHERFHARFWVIRILLDKAWVDDIYNALNRNRRLGNVGREDDLA